MDLSYTLTQSHYVESNLIAYIGNKRRLLPLIVQALSRCAVDDFQKATFFDPFAGTGVISRLAKSLGFLVHSNDWEHYSYLINRLYIHTNPSDLNRLFRKRGGLEKTIEILNQLKKPSNPDAGYISKYYCPRQTDSPDLMNERMFYTQETGKKIDVIREQIRLWYESKSKSTSSPSDDLQKEKEILLALLLYEAATRANTSGVFKGFHRGFGGTGKDALSRIFKPLALYYPVLFENQRNHQIYQEDANTLAEKLSNEIQFDIAYLDPPYNQHQYGSNYHLLNTIAWNDKPPINEQIYVNGKKTNKSAIRKDWTQTRSEYCYKQTAHTAFESLIDRLNARYILISYSNEGIIKLEEMMDLLSKKGKIDMVTKQYTKYRGGKQALTTEANNIESVIVVDTKKVYAKKNKDLVKKTLLYSHFTLYLKKTFNAFMFVKLKFKRRFCEKGIIFEKSYGRFKVLYHLNDFMSLVKTEVTTYLTVHTGSQNALALAPSIILYQDLPIVVQENINQDLKMITDVNKDEELKIVLETIAQRVEQNPPNEDIVPLILRIPILLKKYNNRKSLITSLQMIQRICQTLIPIRQNHAGLYQKQRIHRLMNTLQTVMTKKLSYIPLEESDQWRLEVQKGLSAYKSLFQENKIEAEAS